MVPIQSIRKALIDVLLVDEKTKDTNDVSLIYLSIKGVSKV